MADAVTERVTTTLVTLVMDEEEAGYLRNALSNHLAGTLVSSKGPLGKILAALKDAQVSEVKAWRVKGLGNYAALYANYEDLPENMRHEAEQP